jgi:hypothetical protein
MTREDRLHLMTAIIAAGIYANPNSEDQKAKDIIIEAADAAGYIEDEIEQWMKSEAEVKAGS